MAGGKLPFRDRREAGRLLARQLLHLADKDPLILALPRGGVPVAFEVAKALNAELDLLLVRKLGLPGNEEFGIGAVVDGANPQVVLNEPVLRQFALHPDYVREEARRQLQEIERRRLRYCGSRRPSELSGRTVIIVDDGIATGGTVRAALAGVRKSRPSRLVLAVPVASQEVAAALVDECDELICLATPHAFQAVGNHYVNFEQTSDEEVITLLGQAESFGERMVG